MTSLNILPWSDAKKTEITEATRPHSAPTQVTEAVYTQQPTRTATKANKSVAMEAETKSAVENSNLAERRSVLTEARSKVAEGKSLSTQAAEALLYKSGLLTPTAVTTSEVSNVHEAEQEKTESETSLDTINLCSSSELKTSERRKKTVRFCVDEESNEDDVMNNGDEEIRVCHWKCCLFVACRAVLFMFQPMYVYLHASYFTHLFVPEF